MRHAVVIEQAEGSFSAYVPDLPDCVATRTSIKDVEHEIQEAIAFHVHGVRKQGLPLPVAASVVEYVEVAA